jgi:hypothetical protein
MGEIENVPSGTADPYGTTDPRPAIAVATGSVQVDDGLTDTVAAAFRGLNGRAMVQLYTIDADGALTEFGAAFDAGFAEEGRAWIAFGDVNGDGFDDLILGTGVAPTTVSSASIRIFLNDGTGVIDENSQVIVIAPFADLVGMNGVAIRVAAGDLSGNGVAEIAVTTAGAFDVRLAIISFDVTDINNPVPIISDLGIVDFGFNYQGGAFVAIGRLDGGDADFQLLISTGNNTFNNPLYGNGRIAAFEFEFNLDLEVTTVILIGTVEPPPLAPNSIGIGFNIAFGTLDPDDGFDQIVLGQQRGGGGVAQAFVIFFDDGMLQLEAFGDPIVPIDPLDVLPGELNRGTFVAIADVEDPI